MIEPSIYTTSFALPEIDICAEIADCERADARSVREANVLMC